MDYFARILRATTLSEHHFMSFYSYSFPRIHMETRSQQGLEESNVLELTKVNFH